ncbi:MAG TPA: TIGR01777 family oxidoreductase [Candidatus Baltobacteraceae bacterium]|nr:TIGR01777 family oxidoreductase [Candidatus Baltobacteraceae bacterium]
MRVGVIGASGFIGRHLVAALQRRGDAVVSASLRNPALAAARLRACETIVNLAGEPIAQRWSAPAKDRIVRSRTDAPRALIDVLGSVQPRPSAYVSASAVGYYGTSETETFVETSPPGRDFLAEVCIGWEREAMRAAEFGMRVAIVRTGVALGTDGGALAHMLPPFKIGAGGVIGNGKQWLSWVHVDDVVAMYLRAIDGASGVFNATAPTPVTNREFTRALGEALHRPAILPVPMLALRLMLGEGAEMLLNGQRVLPERAQAEGYRFAYTDLQTALHALV